MSDRSLQWLTLALLLGVVLLALAGTLRWDVLKLWLRGLVMPRREPHLTVAAHPAERHRHAHRPHAHRQRD